MTCPDVSKCCGTLSYKSTCLVCVVFARLVKLADLTNSIVLDPHDRIETPRFVRTWAGETVSHGEGSLYSEVLAELLRVRSIPIAGPVNHVVRTLLLWLKMGYAWSRGELVRKPREVRVGA